MTKRKRYSLPFDKAYRAFGSPDVITNDNITDEMVEALLKTNPEARRVFIDADAPAQDKHSETTDLQTDLENLTVAQLLVKYAEVTQGKVPASKIKADLVKDLKYEIEASSLLG